MSELEIDGGKLPLKIKRNPRARRIILRLDREGTGVVLTIPFRASRQRAVDFAKTHSDWIREKLGAAARRTVFADGAIIPLCLCPPT